MSNNEKIINDIKEKKSAIAKARFLIRQYELVKSRKHPKIKFITTLFKLYNINKNTFYYQYSHYLKTKNISEFLLKKRGPVKNCDKNYSKKFNQKIISEIIIARRKGMNRQEISNIIKDQFVNAPSLSTIYRIITRNNLATLKDVEIANKLQKRK